MLGKLLKQELKTQGKTVFVMYGVLAIATLLTIVSYFAGRFAGARIFSAIFVVVCAIYAMTLVVTVVANFISLCFHFYQSMYSAQGYLTHTLPMKSTQILHVKIVAAFAYMCLTGILSIASFVTIAIVVDGQSFASFFQVLVKAFCDTAQELGVSSVWFALFFLLLFFLGFLNALLLFFAGSSIGQLSHRSKGAFGIAATVGLYYASQIVSLIGFFIGSLIYAEKFGTVHNPAPWAIGAGSLLLIFWVAVYYMICRIIVQKHLNLE